MSSFSRTSRKKVLLMGKSGSGKTSMRSIVFNSQLAADTRRLGATIDVENSTINFLGGLRLDLWDCGGQDSFMDQHLTSQSSTIFRNAHSLIYIFDAESPDLLSSDTHYFLKCLAALQHQNPPSTPRTNGGGGAGGAVAATSDAPSGPTVFVLLHKMDLVPEALQASKLAEFVAEVKRRAADAGWKGDLRFYGTSIWNETLYRAWSTVVAHLMPSLASLRTHLAHFLSVTSASEVVLFERTTFLVIASVTAPEFEGEGTDWDKRRFERVSTMVKAFKLGCTRVRSTFGSLTVSTPGYTAVLDLLTAETYVLVVTTSDIQPAAIELNIKLARPHFNKVESIGKGN